MSSGTTRRARGRISVGLGLGAPLRPRTRPTAGSLRTLNGAEFFDELAVMVDTFRLLEPGEAGRAADDGRCAWSWVGGKDEQTLDGAG
jgi:hypothetical protein